LGEEGWSGEWGGAVVQNRRMWTGNSHTDTLTLRAERQSAWTSKITNDQLNPVRYGMLCSCTDMATVGVKVLYFAVCSEFEQHDDRSVHHTRYNTAAQFLRSVCDQFESAQCLAFINLSTAVTFHNSGNCENIKK